MARKIETNADASGQIRREALDQGAGFIRAQIIHKDVLDVRVLLRVHTLNAFCNVERRVEGWGDD